MAQRTDLLDKVVQEIIERRTPALGDTRLDALKWLAVVHDANSGFYTLAKEYGVLEENSAAEFSCQFYTAYNAEIEYRY